MIFGIVLPHQKLSSEFNFVSNWPAVGLACTSHEA